MPYKDPETKKAHDKAYRETHREEHNRKVREAYVPLDLLLPDKREQRVNQRKEEGRRYYLAHQEEEKERSKIYRQEHLEEILTRDGAYRAAHREACRARSRSYTATHPEAIAAKRKRYRATNRDAINAYRRNYRKTHAELVTAHDRSYRATHLDQIAAATRRWKEKDPNHVRVLRAAWWKAHPLEHQEKDNRRRAAKRQAFVEKVDLKAVYERDKGRCGICLKKMVLRGATLDHILPLAKGGEHSYRNIQLAHRSCNSRKRDTARIPQQLRLVG